MPPLRFISYIRVSTTGQAVDGTGLETQEIETTEYIRRHDARISNPAEVVAQMGAILVGMESDPGESGTDYPRPGLERALSRLQSGEANALIVHKVDRLGRDAYIPLVVFNRIKQMGCRLWTVEDGEILDKHIIVYALKSGMAQDDHRGIVERLKSGKRRIAEKGKQPNRSARPYGYSIVKKIEDGQVRDDAGTYLVIEEEERVVKAMFQDYAEGVTLGMIATRLQRAGVPTVKLGGRWWPITISRMLHSPLYKGEAMWGKTVNVYKEGKRAQRTATGAPQIPIAVPPIVTPELWQQVQDRLALNVNEKSRHDRTHLFSGLVFCPVCGFRACCQTLTSYKEPRVVYKCRYFAPSATPEGRVCNKASYYERDILACLRETFKTRPQVPFSQWVQMALRKQEQKQAKSFDVSDMEEIRKKIREAEKLQAVLIDMEQSARMRGSGLESVQKRQDKAAEDQTELQAKLRAMERLAQAQTPQEFQNRAENFLEGAREILSALEDCGTHHERNQKLKSFLSRIQPVGKRKYECYLREFPDIPVSEILAYFPDELVNQKGKIFG